MALAHLKFVWPKLICTGICAGIFMFSDCRGIATGEDTKSYNLVCGYGCALHRTVNLRNMEDLPWVGKTSTSFSSFHSPCQS